MTRFLLAALCALVISACSQTAEEETTLLVSSTAPTHQITFKNQCHESVWVGSVGNAGHDALGGGGWEMAQGSNTVMQAPVGWSGRFWPRTGCEFNANGVCPTEGVKCCASGSCLTSDNKNFGLACANSGVPPASLMEATFDAPSGNGPIDTYDISFVDGWSVPVAMVADAGTFNLDPDPGMVSPWCTQSGCTAEPVCPDEYKVDGSPRSCWSPCQYAVNTGESDPDQSRMCCACTMQPPAPGQPAVSCPDAACAGGFGCTPYHDPVYPADMTCNPWSTDAARGWDATALSYISAVKTACPEVYAWQFDDHAATFQCRKTDGLVNYTVTLCP
jgi:hypothetical protein